MNLTSTNERKQNRWAILILAVCFSLAAGILLFGEVLFPPEARNPDHIDFWLKKFHEGGSEWRVPATLTLASYFGPAEERRGELEGADKRQDEIQAALVEALDDPRAKIRLQAVFALRKVEEAHSHLRKLTDDPDPRVRQAAQGVLDGTLKVAEEDPEAK